MRRYVRFQLSSAPAQRDLRINGTAKELPRRQSVILVLLGCRQEKEAPGVSAKCLIPLPNLVGAIGLEPTTPTMSRWETGTLWDVLGRCFTYEDGLCLSREVR
jgi:hypothetical protein